MEIREGIIYKSGLGKKVCISKIDKNNVEVYFDDDKSDTGFDTIDVVLEYFKKETFKLIYYPYKLGDWVYDINDEYTKSHKTPKITQITNIKGKDIYSYSRYYVNNEDSGVTEQYFQLEYRPCFDHEIPKEKIKKESMTYLIKFLKKRGII